MTTFSSTTGSNEPSLNPNTLDLPLFLNPAVPDSDALICPLCSDVLQVISLSDTIKIKTCKKLNCTWKSVLTDVNRKRKLPVAYDTVELPPFMRFYAGSSASNEPLPSSASPSQNNEEDSIVWEEPTQLVELGPVSTTLDIDDNLFNTTSLSHSGEEQTNTQEDATKTQETEPFDPTSFDFDMYSI